MAETMERTHFFSAAIDTQLIRGVIHTPRVSRPHAIVVCCHGVNGDRTDAHRILLKAAVAWAGAGFVTARFDYRGCGLSDGLFWQATPPARVADIQVVVADLRKQWPGLPIVLHGFSDGARLVLDSAPVTAPQAVTFWSPVLLYAATSPAVRCEPPFRRPDTIARLQALGPTPPETWRRLDKRGTLVRPFYGNYLSLSYVQHMASFAPSHQLDCPAFAVYDQNDPSVTDSLALLQESVLNVSFLTLTDTGHVFSTPNAERAAIGGTSQWLATIFPEY